MKISIPFILLFFYTNSLFSQISKELKADLLQKQVGFIYFVNSEFPTFVPCKNQNKNLQISDFETKRLLLAFQLNWNELALDTLTKFIIKKKIYNYDRKNAFLNIIPAILTYTIFSYSKTTKQIKESMTIDNFKFSNAIVEIQSIGGLPIRIESLQVVRLVIAK